MAYIDKNGITFTTFDGNGSGLGKKVQNNQNQGASIDDLSEIAQDNSGELPSIINALEIDWNGAKPGIGEDNNGIQSTGELLSLLKQIYTTNQTLDSNQIVIPDEIIEELDNQ